MKLPLDQQIAKSEAQALLHSVEELYFFRRYEEGAEIARKMCDSERLDEDTRQSLRYYNMKCSEKAGLTQGHHMN
jgi:hypothetical protein